MASIKGVFAAPWMKIAVAVAILALLWRNTDGMAISRAVAQADLGWIIFAVVLLLAQTLLSAVRWRVTAAALGQAFSYPYAVREYFLSQVINQAVPGAVVGDAARAVRAGHQTDLGLSGAAVALERLAGQIAMFFTLAIGFGLSLLIDTPLIWPNGTRALVGLIICTIFAGLMVWVALTYRYGAGQGRFARVVQSVRQAFWTQQVIGAQVALGVGITLCNIGAFAACVVAVGGALPVLAMLILVPLVLFAMLVPLTISGWGLREGAAAAVLPIAGISVIEAIAASILFGVAILIAAAPGLFTIGKS
ncbi:lysylphosphatidylglycerol synthase transmembrane domain-containing protein [Epibacterium ulvae]|uniref:lysylphosphatidylglycerol synthase transmembrane domain-containing protein n=1 Tax=Epibacterium ulvae TaxID=1156985 RepID=UPI0024931F59|nr:lysylphosphatidylglycerol synthase transmembrane domain-containing protein [Epibacterium ulvae]